MVGGADNALSRTGTAPREETSAERDAEAAAAAATLRKLSVVQQGPVTPPTFATLAAVAEEPSGRSRASLGETTAGPSGRPALAQADVRGRRSSNDDTPVPNVARAQFNKVSAPHLVGHDGRRSSSMSSGISSIIHQARLLLLLLLLLLLR